MTIGARIDQTLRTIPDFPKPGIQFKDITPLMEDPALSRDIVAAFQSALNGVRVDAIVGVESRGFLYGLPLAIAMNVPFITVRKKGKLPYKTVSYSYDLEYGSAVIEMHQDSIRKDWNVLIHDDLLATGGTAAAAAELVKMEGGQIAGFSFIIGLNFLNGRKKLEQYSENIINLVEY